MLRILTALLCGWFVLAAMPALAADNSFTLNSSYPEQSLHTRGAQLFAQKVLQYTDSAVKITVVPDGALGFHEPELLSAVRDGKVPLSDMLMGAMSRSERAFAISTLPRLVHSYAEARRLYDLSRPLYEALCAKWGQVMLYAAPWPPSGLFTTAPVRSVKEIAALRVRTFDSTSAGFLARTGAMTLDLPWLELRSALHSDSINAVLTSPVSAVDAKLWLKMKHYLELGYAYPLNMVTMNRKVFNDLTPEQRAAVRRAAAETEAEQWRASEEQYAQALKTIQDAGITVSKPDAALEKTLDAIASDMLDEFKWRTETEVSQVLSTYNGD